MEELVEGSREFRDEALPAREDLSQKLACAQSPHTKPLERTDRGWSGLIFAAKTAASALIALLVAFTFNFDQPQWALLIVFIVAQPQTGLVLAKSFYRIIGILIGAGVALLFAALFAQERVPFLGALALWVGLCTFGFKCARNFTAIASSFPVTPPLLWASRERSMPGMPFTSPRRASRS